MSNIKNYPAIHKQLCKLHSILEELKNHYMNHPSQYILYEISNIKKQIDNLTKHKQILRRKLIGQFFRKYNC